MYCQVREINSSQLFCFFFSVALNSKKDFIVIEDSPGLESEL